MYDGTVNEPDREFPRELAQRAANGIEVTLLWWPARGELTVAVVEQGVGRFEVPVGDAPPLDVYHHPYAYAAVRSAARRTTGTPAGLH